MLLLILFFILILVLFLWFASLSIIDRIIKKNNSKKK